VNCGILGGHRFLAWAGIAIAIAVGCYAAPLPLTVLVPPVDRLPDSSASVADLEAGRDIYLSSKKCARCHTPKAVYSYSKKEWAYAVMPRMGKKAELTHTEYDEVLAYVEAASSVQPPKNK
jgi:mono/diheme cytochrome c family protein